MRQALCLLLGLIGFLPTLFSQVEVSLTIQNQELNGSDYQFDIYMHTTSSSSGILYLGTADFVLDFNALNFTNPTFSKVGTSPGNNTFKPTDEGGLNPLFTQASYFDNTAVSIAGNQLIVNLVGPSPGDQTTFDSRVAKIDGLVSTHRLGTFQLSGYNNGGLVGLTWDTTRDGLQTQGFTLANNAPFTSTAADLVATNPVDFPGVLPVELLYFSAKENGQHLVDLSWATSTEIDNSHFVIERSVDGIRFDSIGMVNGNGTTQIEQVYSFIDKYPLVKGYYRLKQVDFDGALEYSNIAVVAIRKSNDASLLAYPTLAKSEIFVRFNAFEKQISELRITSYLGEVVYEEVINASNNLILKKINLADFGLGMYQVSLSNGSVLQSTNFVVVH